MSKFNQILLVIVLGLYGNAASSSELITPSQFENAISKCVAASNMDEFDSIEDVIARVSTSCDLHGTFRRTAPTLPGLGHMVTYNSANKEFVYVVTPDVQATTGYGGGASPYGIRYKPFNRKELKKPIRKELTRLGNSTFWLLPLMAKNDVTDSYEATNAYGAKVKVARHKGDRISLNIPVDWSRRAVIVARFPIASKKAREVSKHLGLEVDFAFKRPCDICFSGGTSEKGTFNPTFKSPYDIKLMHQWAYAEVTTFKLIDMRTGEILGTSPFKTAKPTK